MGLLWVRFCRWFLVGSYVDNRVRWDFCGSDFVVDFVGDF